MNERVANLHLAIGALSVARTTIVEALPQVRAAGGGYDALLPDVLQKLGITIKQLEGLVANEQAAAKAHDPDEVAAYALYWQQGGRFDWVKRTDSEHYINILAAYRAGKKAV